MDHLLSMEKEKNTKKEASKDIVKKGTKGFMKFCLVLRD